MKPSMFLCLTCFLASVMGGGLWGQLSLTPENGGTGQDGAFQPFTNVTLDTDVQAVFNFTTFAIPAGVAVTCRGSLPITIKVQGAVVVDGMLDCSGLPGANSSNNLPGGAGGFGGAGGGIGGAGGCLLQAPFSGAGADGTGASPGLGGIDSGLSFTDPVGGGGGGGNATAGLMGGPPTSGAPGNTSGAGGVAVSKIRAGSGGGGGACDVDSLTTGSANDGGGGGGGGGGMLCLSSNLSITVSTAGAILATGGPGGSSAGNGGAGGGGSGGLLLLLAPSIQVQGTLSALGGAGGFATQSGGCGCSPGGAGGDGQIQLLGASSGNGLAAASPAPLLKPYGAMVSSGAPDTSIQVTVPAGDSYLGVMSLTLGPSFPMLGGHFQLSLLDPIFALTFPTNQLAPLVTGLSGSGSGAITLTFSGVTLPLFNATFQLQVLSLNGNGFSAISGVMPIRFKL